MCLADLGSLTAQMQAYVTYTGCLMEFLVRALDDPTARPCGICANCRGKGLTSSAGPVLVAAAQEFLGGEQLLLEPRKRWPIDFFPEGRSTILEEHRNAIGRFLSFYADSGWGNKVKHGKYGSGHYDDNLVEAAARVIQRWRPDPRPEWVTAIPSLRHLHLVADFARRLAAKLGLPFHAVLTCAERRPEQKTMANSHMQAQNARAMFGAAGDVPRGPVLLVDDIIDSGWTMTVAGWFLRTHGSGVVHPFALARASQRKAYA